MIFKDALLAMPLAATAGVGLPRRRPSRIAEHVGNQRRCHFGEWDNHDYMTISSKPQKAFSVFLRFDNFGWPMPRPFCAQFSAKKSGTVAFSIFSECLYFKHGALALRLQDIG
jgi:hypothetical protein